MEILTPDVVMSGTYFNTLKGCFVYEWVRDGHWLYIGSTKAGISRPFSHQVIGVSEPVLDGDQIILTRFSEYRPAFEYENSLIKYRRPRYNTAGLLPLHGPRWEKAEPVQLMPKTCPRCMEVYIPKKPWQKYCGGRRSCKLDLKKSRESALETKTKAAIPEAQNTQIATDATANDAA